MYSIQVTTQPSVEPVSVATLQKFLRTNASSEVADLGPAWITAARMLFERETNLCLITQTVTQFNELIPVGITYLMRGPIQSINSVKYYDNTGTLVTDTTHQSDLITGGMGRIWWNAGQPNTSTVLRPVLQTSFQAGFGDTAADVPAPICQAIALLASYWFEQRSAFSDLNIQDVPMGFSAIVDQYKIGNNYQWQMNKYDGYMSNGFNPYNPYGYFFGQYGW